MEQPDRTSQRRDVNGWLERGAPSRAERRERTLDRAAACHPCNIRAHSLERLRDGGMAGRLRERPDGRVRGDQSVDEPEHKGPDQEALQPWCRQSTDTARAGRRCLFPRGLGTEVREHHCKPTIPPRVWRYRVGPIHELATGELVERAHSTVICDGQLHSRRAPLRGAQAERSRRHADQILTLELRRLAHSRFSP